MLRTFGKRRALGMMGGGVAAVPLLPFTDDFARADGDLGNGWEYTAGKWTIASGNAVGTPGLGADVAVNGAFASDISWVKGAGWTIESGVARKAAGSATTIAQSVLTANKFFSLQMDIATITAGTFFIGLSEYGIKPSTTGTKIFTGLTQSAALSIAASADGAGDIDNVIAKQIVTADMFATKDFEASDVDISMPVTQVTNQCFGIVIGLDSVATPANYIYAQLHLDGAYVRLAKVVGGVFTSLIDTSLAGAYAAGRVLRVTKSGSTVKVFYNGTQIGADKTVADAGIVDNTRHGMFSTSGSCSIGEITINP